jgi:hypothetical protein
MTRTARILIPAALIVAAALAAPAASARVNVSVNISIPPRIHPEEVAYYDPYYVGRVYYEPAHRWQLVYSFPVHVAGRTVYRPYVYDRGRMVCHDSIPSRGYGQLVIEGGGRFDPSWYPRHRVAKNYRVHDRYDDGRARYARARNRDWDRRDDWSDSGSGSGSSSRGNWKHDRKRNQRRSHR